MLSRFNITVLAGILAASATVAASQTSPKPSPTPNAAVLAKGQVNLTAEQLAETAVFSYGFPGYATIPIGRDRLNQIRKTTIEKGRTVHTTPDGKTEQATYQRYVIRGEDLSKEKIRLDQDFPTARYALIYSGDKIFGVYNNTVFAPREDASRSFGDQINHGLEALLRYKENGSTLELAPREKVMGVDYHVLDVTDKQSRKTRFYISAKTYRVMMLTYEEAGVKYKRRFYDYNYAQGTLVPFRSVLWADDKQVEESEVGTITFGQKVDDGMFTGG